MKHIKMLKSAVSAFAATAAVAVTCVLVAPVAQAAAAAAPQLHVSGNKLVDHNGAAVVLHGVNRSGGEFACVQNNGIWDGPMDQASVSAIKSWNVTAVRVPLNEACWNSESYVNRAYSGSTYQNAVASYVNLLNANGIVAILDLHWTDGVYTGTSSGCSSAQATCQKPMPDAAQAIPFWTSVANAFKGNNAVVFDLFNEPYPERATGSESSGWACWRNGGTCNGIGYQVAGMQAMVNAVRSTGASNVLMLGGLAYSNDLSQWNQYKPSDPTGNLAASWHSYSFNVCNSSSCWNSQIAPVIANSPLITGELGESDCGDSYINPLMSWLDGQHTGYLAWTWNTWSCAGGNILITDYSGTPTAFGAGYKAHLLSLPGSTGGGGTSGPLRAVGAGKCLDVPNRSTTAGMQLEIWDCNGGSNQQFTHTSSGQLTVYSGSSQLCLDAYNGQTTAGTKVQTWTCTGGANQQWNINSNGTITSAQSGLCLDVTGASTANGALVELWTCTGGSNQQWKLG